MTTRDLSVHLNFLNDAAHLLASTAPETAAHLMSQRTGLMLQNNVEQTDVHRQHVCTSCGNIMIPGRGTRLNIEADKALRRRKASRLKPMPGPRKTYMCGLCGSYTKITIPPQRRVTDNRNTTSPLKPSKPTEASAKPSANSSSKKRAKNRKAGLQALLEQNKVSGPSLGHSLSLSDFMKK